MLLFRILLLGTIAQVTLFANIGTVTAIRGDVKITRGIALYQAHKNLEIEEKDTFFTTKNGSMQITFVDNSVITLGKNSVFKVDEYLYNEKNREKNKAKFKFRKGFFKSITGRIGKLAPKNFSIRTKNSTIGVRGTEITGTSNNKSEDIVCTHGEIVVKSLSTKKEYIAKEDEHVEITLDPRVVYEVATSADVLVQNQIKMGIKKADPSSDKDSNTFSITSTSKTGKKKIVFYLKEEIKVVLKPEVKKELLKQGIKVDSKIPVVQVDTVAAPIKIKAKESKVIENNFLLDKPEFKTQPELRKEIKKFTEELSKEDLDAIKASKEAERLKLEAERIARGEEARRFHLAEKERVKKLQQDLESQRNAYKPELPKDVPEKKVSTKKENISKDIDQMDQLLDNMPNRF